MKITMADKTLVMKKGLTVLQILQKFDEKNGSNEHIHALGCFSGGMALELNQKINEDCAIHPITFQNEEGRRIYERSLRFVLLLAVRRLFKGEHVRIEHSLGYGVFGNVIGRILTAEDIQNMEREMHSIVHEKLAFVKERWTRDQAIEYFKHEKEFDKTHLLVYRPYEHFNVYRCGGMCEYFYGAMLPDTSYVSVFALHLHKEGFILQMPAPSNQNVAAPSPNRSKLLSTFAQSNAWCRILGCTNASDLNDMIIKNKYSDFIRLNEVLHDQSISELAKSVQEKEPRAIFIAGPSSSGKTTFSNRLSLHLRVLGLSPVMISLDDFYINRDQIPFEEDGTQDLEAISTLDIDLFLKCVKDLTEGKETLLPKFDFKMQKRKEKPLKIKLSQNQPLIIEGIHALNPMLHHSIDAKYICKIFISELTCLNLDNHNRIRTTDARLLRRIVRDHQFRNTNPVETLKMWNNVRKGEEKWIFPYQESADFIFNSALHYELPVLKNIAYDLLKLIDKKDVTYLSSRRLLKIMHYLLNAPLDSFKEIPPLSLLREFIGGCTFYEQ